MQDRLIEMAVNSVPTQLSDGLLARTGGESLSLIWWIGAGLLVVGVAIGVIAILKRRRVADDPAVPADPADGPE